MECPRSPASFVPWGSHISQQFKKEICQNTLINMRVLMVCPGKSFSLLTGRRYFIQEFASLPPCIQSMFWEWIHYSNVVFITVNMRPWLEAELEVLEINRRDRWVISSGNLRREGEEEKEGRNRKWREGKRRQILVTPIQEVETAIEKKVERKWAQGSQIGRAEKSN